MSQVEQAVEAGKWVPIYYGNHYKVARLVGKRQEQEECPGKFGTLAQAEAEADKRNAR